MVRGSKIYIVDDDKGVRESLRAVLETAGYVCEIFSSGKEFLDGSWKDNGCLLLDVRMPGINGLELHKRLKDAGSKLSVIMITGHGDIPMAVKSIKQGATDFIEKPYSKETIMEAIENALSASGPEPEHAVQAPDARSGIAKLTPREFDVLKQLVIGNPNKIIAYELAISPRTVEKHRKQVMEKMQARSLSHLVRQAIAAGIDVAAD